MLTTLKFLDEVLSLHSQFLNVFILFATGSGFALAIPPISGSADMFRRVGVGFSRAPGSAFVVMLGSTAPKSLVLDFERELAAEASAILIRH